MKKVRILFNRILCKPVLKDQTSAGILLMEEKEEPYMEVMAIGKHCGDIKVGDLVIPEEGVGDEVELVGGERCYIFYSHEIVAKVDD